ncbi:MAG: LapA family protein [Methyloprofundus sp.]|nr:LapA family protein [Methyloprofundus sp.]
MIKIIAIIFFIVIAIGALGFSLLNFQIVDINFYSMHIQLPLAVALTIELIVGIIIGFFASYTQLVKLKAENRMLTRGLNKK